MSFWPSADSGNPGSGANPIPAPAPAPPKYKTRFGLEVSFNFNDAPPMLSDLRPKFVRMDTSTYLPGNDAFVSSMNAQGIDVLLITPYDYLREPRTPAQMANFMTTTAAKYKGRVWAYEVMNEVNAPAGSNGGASHFEPAEYLAYLTAIATAIRVADPAAKIITSGTSGAALDWHRGLAALHPERYADFIGFHPYGCDPATVGGVVAQLAQIHGATPLICTEYGDGDPLKAVAMHKALDGIVHSSVFFSWQEPGYGLVAGDGTRRASYDPMKALFTR